MQGLIDAHHGNVLIDIALDGNDGADDVLALGLAVTRDDHLIQFGGTFGHFEVDYRAVVAHGDFLGFETDEGKSQRDRAGGGDGKAVLALGVGACAVGSAF